jgi:hypothetical protein
MNIETVIRNAFEKEIERLKPTAPSYNRDITIPTDKEKPGKGRYGFLVLCMIMVSMISIFSLKTGLLRSPLIAEWENITTLIPEDIITLFFEFIAEINSSV